MEKRLPHYRLADIQVQMIDIQHMNLTMVAQDGIRLAGMAKADALAVVRGLSRTDFYKSMTTQQNYKIWQDVYHADWCGKPLYVKFQQADEYFVVSFKEL